jgi:hypothetical protein
VVVEFFLGFEFVVKLNAAAEVLYEILYLWRNTYLELMDVLRGKTVSCIITLWF